jgi:preprotein translocase subunit SecF
MFEIIPPGLRCDFVAWAKQAILLSVLVIVIGLVSIVVRGGLNLGIDFSGGSLLQLRFSGPVAISAVRDVLSSLGLGDSTVQHFGEDREILVRVSDTETAHADLGSQVLQALQERFTDQTIELRRTEVVGSAVSSDLRRQAFSALFYAILGIVIYISGRFEAKWFAALVLAVALFGVTSVISQWFPGVPPTILIVLALLATIVFCLFLQLRYALAAIVALLHDVLITVGFFSLFDKPFNLPIVAALLTIVGYSLNDTIIVFDRIRELMQGQRREQFAETVNASINQTLSRTVLTAGTTLIVVLALFFFGGEVIHDFAFALLVGIVVGTYSSIFIASPLLVYWNASARVQRLTLVPRKSSGDRRTQQRA